MCVARPFYCTFHLRRVVRDICECPTWDNSINKSTMSRREEHPAQSSGRSVLPPVNSRTLHHPTFLPLYMTAHFGHQHRNCSNQAAHPIIPAEIFYSDPAMGPGARIPNTVTDMRVLEFYQLNTPPPVMSTSLATPNSPDLFRSGPYPIRDLGSTSWSVQSLHRPVPPRQVIIQLSQEEDQAITNLLKLYNQGPLEGSESFSSAKPALTSAVGLPLDFNCRLFQQTSPHHTDVQQRRAWSDSELEAANTLLSRFILTQDNELWDQNNHKSVETSLVFLPDQHSGPQTRHGSVASFCCTGQQEDTSWQDVVSAVAEVRGWALSDAEGDTVHVLLSLAHMGPAEPVQ